MTIQLDGWFVWVFVIWTLALFINALVSLRSLYWERRLHQAQAENERLRAAYAERVNRNLRPPDEGGAEK